MFIKPWPSVFDRLTFDRFIDERVISNTFCNTTILYSINHLKLSFFARNKLVKIIHPTAFFKGVALTLLFFSNSLFSHSVYLSLFLHVCISSCLPACLYLAGSNRNRSTQTDRQNDRQVGGQMVILMEWQTEGQRDGQTNAWKYAHIDRLCNRRTDRRTETTELKNRWMDSQKSVSYTHLTLPTNREV